MPGAVTLAEVLYKHVTNASTDKKSAERGSNICKPVLCMQDDQLHSAFSDLSLHHDQCTQADYDSASTVQHHSLPTQLTQAAAMMWTLQTHRHAQQQSCGLVVTVSTCRCNYTAQ